MGGLTTRQGARGGLRIIYFYFESEQQIWLMALYGKNEAADLSAKEKTSLKSAIERESRVRVERRQRRGG